MDKELPPGRDPAVAAHVTRRFDEATAERKERVRALAVTDPAFADEAGALALSLDRAGDYVGAIEFATRAVTAKASEDEVRENAVTREARMPVVGLNAGAVLLHAAARWRLAGVHHEEAEKVRQIAGYPVASNDAIHNWVRDQAADQLTDSHAGMLAKGYNRLPRPHQHYINLLPRMGALALSQAQPGRAARFGLQTMAVSWRSESAWLAQGTSSLTLKEKMVGMPKLKSAFRGTALMIGAALALPGVRSNGTAQKARDRIILSAS